MATELESLQRKLREVEEAMKGLRLSGRERSLPMGNLQAEHAKLSAAIAAERRRPTQPQEDKKAADAMKVYDEASPYVRSVMMAPPESPSWTSLGTSVGRKIATAGAAGALGVASAGLRSLAVLPQHRQAVGVVCVSSADQLEELCKLIKTRDGWREEWFSDRPFLLGTYRINCDTQNITLEGKNVEFNDMPLRARVVFERTDKEKELFLTDPQSRDVTFDWLKL